LSINYNYEKNQCLAVYDLNIQNVQRVKVCRHGLLNNRENRKGKLSVDNAKTIATQKTKTMSNMDPYQKPGVFPGTREGYSVPASYKTLTMILISHEQAFWTLVTHFVLYFQIRLR